MEGGDGMVAMVRGCGRAGLSVTLFDGGRKYTLMPNQTVNLNASQQSCSQNVSTTQPVVVRNPAVVHQPMINPPMMNTPNHQPYIYQRCPQQTHFNRMDRHSSQHSTMTNTDRDKRDISAQVTDGRYTTVYKMLHCKESPTSPPVQVTEFPPQRPTLVPGHGNFQVGGVGSCQDNYAACPITNAYHGAMVWSDRGAVYSPRSSRQLDPFANSLRKYPSLSPERSNDVMERLVNYSKNSKQKLVSNPHHQYNQGTEAAPMSLRDHLRYEECRRLEDELSTVKDNSCRAEYDYLKNKQYGNGPDVRYFKEKNKYNSNNSPSKRSLERRSHEKTVNPSTSHKENQGIQHEQVLKKEKSPDRLPRSNDNIAVSPAPTTSQVSAASAQAANSYSTAVENLTNAISIQTLYTPGAALKQKKSVGTTLSSIEFSKCSCRIHLRKTKSEDTVENKLYKWFSSIDDEFDGKIIRAKTVMKLKQNISEWGECLKKGIQHVICYKDDSWYSDSDDSFRPVAITANRNEGRGENEESDIEEVVGYLLNKINNSKEIQAHNLHRETINTLGSKLKEIVARCKRKKQQSIKDDLLNALYELPLDVSQTTKKTCLEDLANSLTETMNNVSEQNAIELSTETQPPELTITDLVPIKPSLVEKESGRPKLRSATFVVLPTQLVKATNFPSVVKKPSKYAIMNKTADDIKANLVIYVRQLSAKVYEWLECIQNEIPYIEEAKLADAVKNLAEDIVDRLRYRELSAIQSIKTSNESDLEHLKYQIFKWINKYVGENNLTTLKRAPDLMKKIETVPIPNILQTINSLQDDEESDSSNHTLGERSAKKDLMEKVSEVLPVFKNCINTNKSNTYADVETSPTRVQSELKKCNSFEKETNQSLAKNSRYVKIANVSTSPHSGRVCCSGPPLSGPETRINRVNDEYFEYLDSWLRRIPIPYSSDSDRELADKARMGISNAFLQCLYSLSLDPAKLSDRFYYEDILEDVLDDLFSELPQIPELCRMKPILKAQLIDKTINTYELMYKIRDNVSYQQQFVHTVQAMIPNKRRSHERLSDEMEICSFVDEFILSVRYQNDDPDRSKWHRDRAYKKIEAFVDQLCRCGKIDADRVGWAREIMDALDNVPAPSDEILRDEVNRIRLEEEIEDWYLSLPVIDNEEVYERIRRKNLKALLVKKIFDMDREINLGDCAGQRELKYEISRFIEKLPLREDGNLNMNIMINTLLTKLKTRNRQREFEQNSRKVVSFDDVHPAPRCCQPNHNYHTSMVNQQYEDTLGPPHADFMEETLEYSQFHENIPKSSSYNEQNYDDNMKFYSLDETCMPQDLKHTFNKTQEDYKYHTLQGCGQTSTGQTQRQDASDMSNQRYQVPNQRCISKPPKCWRQDFHTSQPGPSGVNRTYQPTYPNLTSPGQTVSHTQKSYLYQPPNSSYGQDSGPPVCKIQQNPVDSSKTSSFKPSGPPCCEKPLCFKSKGPNQGPSCTLKSQPFDSTTVTQDSSPSQALFRCSKKAETCQASAFSRSKDSESGNATPNSMLDEARVVSVCCNQPSTFNRCCPSPPSQPQRCQIPCQGSYPATTDGSKAATMPCYRPIQMGSQHLSTTQMSQCMPPMQTSQAPMSSCHESVNLSSQQAMMSGMQQSQIGSHMAVTSTGRPICSPCYSGSTNQPKNKRNHRDKSCLMPGCTNPNCKVPKSKRRKIQQLQLQLQKMYESGAISDGPGSNRIFECTPNAKANKNYRCRCMEFYIKKCKKARNCKYPYNDCTAVLDIPPCIAFRAPHPCFI